MDKAVLLFKIIAPKNAVQIFFVHLQEREKYVHQLEVEIEQERNMADNLVSAMQPDLRDRYIQLKNQNMQFQMRMAMCAYMNLDQVL